jgi:hypothetical protein
MTPCALALATVIRSMPGADSAHVPTIADAIATVAPTPERAALLVAIGYRESGFMPRIQAGDCRKFECDRGLSRSFWQIHKFSRAPEWHDLLGLEPPTIKLAARVADRKLRSGLQVCKTTAGAASYFARGDCRWPGGVRRGALADSLRPRLSACARVKP